MKRTRVVSILLLVVALGSASCAGAGGAGATCPIGPASGRLPGELSACARPADR